MSRTSLADKLLPRMFINELDQILIQHNHKVHSTSKVIPRDCSPKTRLERRNNLRRVFAELYVLGYRLSTPTSLKQKHVQALAEHWKLKKLSAKTILGLLSNLREFCRWINKHGLVGDIEDYYGAREEFVLQTAAAKDLSWESRGIELCSLFERASQLDRRFEIFLRLMRFFGLRVKEAIEFRPWLATAMDDDYLQVTHGTKGGKPRLVKIRNDFQRQVLIAAKEIVGPEVNSRLRWPDKTWKQAQSHFYYLMRCFGATKKSLEVTAHGLRHEFLQGEYEIYAGVPAAIKGTGALPGAKKDHQRATLAVSLQAGHFRPTISAGYCGSFGHKLRSLPEQDESSSKK